LGLPKNNDFNDSRGGRIDEIDRNHHRNPRRKPLPRIALHLVFSDAFLSKSPDNDIMSIDENR
jgi:hypothetical protein